MDQFGGLAVTREKEMRDSELLDSDKHVRVSSGCH